MKASNEMRVWVKWGIGVLCLIAAGMSLWLSVQKWTGQIDSLAGCGAGSGCANVLGSKWSLVWGVIPVSVFSFLLYLSVLFTLRMSGGRVRWYRSFVAWMCLWAAVWFTGLQWVVLKTICPYCMAMHGLGVLLACVILVGDRERSEKKRVKAGWRRSAVAVVLAACCVAGLAVVQQWGPEPQTYREDVLNAGDVSVAKGDTCVHEKGEGREVTFLNEKKTYRVKTLPHLGSAEADHVVVEYFDYTCEACREMHGLLQALVTRYPEKLAVIVLPVPLHRQCNPYLPQGVEDQENACELARLALQVWRADPAKFAEFHQNLFGLQGMPVELAEALAVSLVGEGALTNSEALSWANAVIAANVEDYRWMVKNTPVMPKLLIRGSVMVQGAMKNESDLEEVLKKHLEW
jgi:protein-disulfide isomerase